MLTSSKDIKIAEESRQVSSYAFIKQSTQFVEVESRLPAPDQKGVLMVTHTISVLRKKPKKGTSDTYSTHNYFKIKNLNGIRKDCQKRLNRINLVTAELLRLIDRHSPKLRLWTDSKAELPLSKSVPGPNEFFEYFQENIYSSVKYTPPQNNQPEKFEYSNPEFFEGMGRGFFGKYIYLDNDFHMGNAFLDRDKYFCVIDNDWAFVPITFAMHSDHKYDNGDNHTLRNYNTLMSVEDYEGLPILKDYIAGNWPWHSYRLVSSYFAVLANDPLFINEKHFSAIKFLITPQFQKQLLEIHVDDEKDKNALVTLLEKRIENLTKILPNSQTFMVYVRLHHIQLMKAILFELNDFFMENRHYLPPRHKPNESREQWRERICPLLLKHILPAIENYSLLLTQLGEAPLSALEKSNLEQFALEICKNKTEALECVKSFYIEQKMRNFEKLVNQILEKNLAAQSTIPSLMKTVAK